MRQWYTAFYPVNVQIMYNPINDAQLSYKKGQN